MNQPTDKIKGLIVILKTDKGLHEVILSDLVKREIFKVIDGYQIVLGAEDLSGVVEIR
jgi:hypothetical protein